MISLIYPELLGNGEVLWLYKSPAEQKCWGKGWNVGLGLFPGDRKQLAMNCAALEFLCKLLLLCGQLSAEILWIAWDFSIFVQFLPHSCNCHWGFFFCSQIETCVFLPWVLQAALKALLGWTETERSRVTPAWSLGCCWLILWKIEVCFGWRNKLPLRGPGSGGAGVCSLQMSSPGSSAGMCAYCWSVLCMAPAHSIRICFSEHLKSI